MVLLYSGAAVNAVVLVAVCGDFQAVPHLEDGFAELEPVAKTRNHENTNSAHNNHSNIKYYKQANRLVKAPTSRDRNM